MLRVSLTVLRFGSAMAVDMQNSMNRIGHPMDLSEVRYWNHRLCFEPPWRLPSPTAMTLEQESQVDNALGVLQRTLEGPAVDLAFDADFLTPIDVSQFSSSSENGYKPPKRPSWRYKRCIGFSSAAQIDRGWCFSSWLCWSTIFSTVSHPEFRARWGRRV